MPELQRLKVQMRNSNMNRLVTDDGDDDVDDEDDVNQMMNMFMMRMMMMMMRMMLMMTKIMMMTMINVLMMMMNHQECNQSPVRHSQMPPKHWPKILLLSRM